jgi:3-hydroxyacyl-[acyl-carrier-protein] dehydratase
MNRPNSADSRAATSDADEARLREALKRCSPAILDSALAFRRNGAPEHLDALVNGLVERYMESGSRSSLTNADGGLRLIEDLGIDSLTLMEIVILAEDALRISINNDELRPIRTLGDFRQFIASRLLDGEPSKPAKIVSRAHVEPEGRERIPAT